MRGGEGRDGEIGTANLLASSRDEGGDMRSPWLPAILLVAVACLSQATFAADRKDASGKKEAKSVSTVADALAELKGRRAPQPPIQTRRKVAQRFGDCIARKLHGKAVTFLLSGQEPDGRKLADSDCFSVAGDFSVGSYPVSAMRSLVADGLVRGDFQTQGPTDFSSVPPLEPAPPQVGDTTAIVDARTIADKVGECAARVSPEAIRRLAQTKAETSDETAQVRELVPTFAQCLPPGVKLAFPPSVLRDAAVLAYARLAFTQITSGKTN